MARPLFNPVKICYNRNKSLGLRGDFLLQQYQFSVPPRPAYRWYAALLSLAPPEFSEEVHRQQMTPLAQYYADGVWTVSLLGSPCVTAMAPVLERLHTLPLHNGPVSVRLLGVRRVENADALLCAPPAPKGRLLLRTPAAFKSGGQYRLLPTTHLVVQNLALRWNACLGQDCALDITPDGLQTLAEGLVYRDISLQSTVCPLKGQNIPGVTGSLTVCNRLSGIHAAVADLLLQFAAFSGVGIKTTLGMGGAVWQPETP